MCTEVWVNDTFCSNVGELRKALGGPVVYDWEGGEAGDDFCLCNLNEQATAELYGLTVSHDHDPEQFGYGTVLLVPMQRRRDAEQTTGEELGKNDQI
jgi:hypothetical protein